MSLARTDAALRRGLKMMIEGRPGEPDELEPADAARRAVVHFILAQDRDVGRYAARGRRGPVARRS